MRLHYQLAKTEGYRYNADIRPSQEKHRSEAPPIHENLQRLWRTQRSNSAEMQKMQGQEPALEETRNRKVTALSFLILYF